MTVKVLDYAGDGSYFLQDRAHELDALRDGGPGAILVGDPRHGVDTALDRVLEHQRADGRRALDVIIAAPKPVSVLLATEPPDVARAVVALHQRAVRATFGYLDDEGRGSAGAAGSRAVGFTHGINRWLDPHLHTHVVLSLHDERGGAISAPTVRAHAAAADALYLSALREGLPGASGRRSWLSPTGRLHVEGVDHGLVAAMSVPKDRRGRVERGTKSHPSHEVVRAHWDDLVARHEPLDVAVEIPAHGTSIDEYRFAALLGGGLVARRHVVRAWAAACRFGQTPGATLAAVDAIAPNLTGSGRVAAAVLRDDRTVRALGSRPMDHDALRVWLVGRADLGRHLAEGHGLAHVRDRRGASARERLSLARLDAAMGGLRARSPACLGTELEAGASRSLS